MTVILFVLSIIPLGKLIFSFFFFFLRQDRYKILDNISPKEFPFAVHLVSVTVAKRILLHCPCMHSLHLFLLETVA